MPSPKAGVRAAGLGAGEVLQGSYKAPGRDKGNKNRLGVKKFPISHVCFVFVCLFSFYLEFLEEKNPFSENLYD